MSWYQAYDSMREQTRTYLIIAVLVGTALKNRLKMLICAL